MWMAGQYHIEGFKDFHAEAYALTVLTNFPLALRRKAPVLVLLASCAALSWYLAEGYVPSLNLFGPLLALYTVAALRPPRVAAACAVPTVATLIHSGLAVELYSVGTAIAQGLVATAVAWMFGTGARRLADRNQRLIEVTEQLRLEREERARSAVTEERLRIARELHDVVAHHMSVVSVQAGLAQYVLTTDPATARTAVETIAGTSHEALEEMRRMLAVLRVGETDEHPDGQPHAPAPGLDRLGELVERISAAGVRVQVTSSGHARPLPPGADLCAFRVVQESLTNVLKHAPAARVQIAFAYGAANLTIRVSDDGPGTELSGDGTGHGLVGMRERAQLYGGTLRAGRGTDGFVVTLTLPLTIGTGGKDTAARPEPPPGSDLGVESG